MRFALPDRGTRSEAEAKTLRRLPFAALRSRPPFDCCTAHDAVPQSVTGLPHPCICSLPRISVTHVSVAFLLQLLQSGCAKGHVPCRDCAAQKASSEIATGTRTMSALDEAIALIDSLCAKLRTEAEGGATGASSKTATGTAAQVAPPVKKPWRTLASSTMPGDIRMDDQDYGIKVKRFTMANMPCMPSALQRTGAPRIRKSGG
jgi:hypothetical protein